MEAMIKFESCHYLHCIDAERAESTKHGDGAGAWDSLYGAW